MKEHYFFLQAHQPLFILTMMNAIVTMLLFVLSYKAIINIELKALFFHIYSTIFLIITPAIIAFILTTFSHTPCKIIITKELHLKIFKRFLLGSRLFIVGVLFDDFIYSLGMLVLLAAQLSSIKIISDIYEHTVPKNRDDIIWIFFGMLVGILSHFLFIVGDTFNLPIEKITVQIAVYLYLFLITFFVAQRMIPFFLHSIISKELPVIKMVLSLLILHIFFKQFQTDFSFVPDFIIGLIIMKEFRKLKLPFFNPNPLLGILIISIYWIPIAFLLGGINTLYSFFYNTHALSFNVHLLMLGFLLTILIGLGTRITLSHSQNLVQIDKWIHIIFVLTQLLIVTVTLHSLLMALGYVSSVIFYLALTLWFTLCITWIIRFFPILIYNKKLKSKE